MSLITSCPACGTMFRVVPDQLKISEGWVRCGHCAEVFDATAHLSDEASSPPAVDEATRPVELPTMPAPMATVPAALDQLPPPPPPPPPLPAPTPPKFAWRDSEQPAAQARAAGPDSQSLEPSELDTPFVFRRSDMFEPEPVPSVLPPAPPLRAAESRPAPLERAGEHDDVSFVRQARRRAFWRRPMVRLGLTFVSLLLAAGLALQIAWTDRDRLAAAQPQLRPALEQMCEHLPCKLQPPRLIEAVVIESSGFNRLRNDAYRLSFALRNTARVTVAAPAMELTLTDPQDQPLLRRVLTPAELGARDDVIAAGAEWSGTVGIVLASNGAARVAGYRLLAFYP